METVAFIVLSVVALASALVVITPVFRNPVMCALALAINLVSIAGFFFLLDAQFIGFLQVIVYAGAIMVLILFVIMLLSITSEERITRSGRMHRALSPVLALACAGALAFAAWKGASGGKFAVSSTDFGTVRQVGRELFSTYFYAFEAISLLLVVAMVGAVLLAKRRL